MVLINNAFRKKIVEDMFSKLKVATAALRLDVYNYSNSVTKDTKLADLGSVVKTFPVTAANINLARQVTLNEDLFIAGNKYKITNTVPADEFYWNVLITDVNISSPGAESYNTVALIYTIDGIDVPILIEKYANPRTLQTETLTTVVKF